MEVRWRHSLRTRLMAWFGALVASLLLLGFAVAYFVSEMQQVEAAEARTRFQAQQSADRLDAAMRSVRITGQGLNGVYNGAHLDRTALMQAQAALLQADEVAVAMLVALEPGVLPDGAPMAWYEGRADRDVGDSDFVATGYDYRAQPWYRRTLVAAEPWWSEPYFNDAAGGVWMVTLNLPMHAPDGRTVGMIGLDVPVRRLSEQLDSMRRVPGQRPTLLAPGGTIAVHPDPGIALRYTLSTYIAAYGRDDLRPLEAARLAGGRFEMTHTLASSRETRFSVLEPIGDSGWRLHLALSHNLLLEQLRHTMVALALAAALATATLAFVVQGVASRITVPLSELTRSASHFAVGEFDWPVPHDARADEVGVMARAMERARDSIRFQLNEIEQMATARQKLESELGIAREIQLAMLPADRAEVAARLEAAKAVGGDFYNFFQTDAQTLWFLIGDVSDKGVPAALFMARVMMVLEVTAGAAQTPDVALREAARYLVDGNDACMFATTLCGVFALASGEFMLASAGHEPPVWLHADGRREFLPLPTAVALGLEVADDYPLWRGRLADGDTLLLYTDGVTEAFDRHDAPFGEARLLAALDPARDAAAQCRELVAQVHAFAGGAPQSDDITVLALRR